MDENRNHITVDNEVKEGLTMHVGEIYYSGLENRFIVPFRIYKEAKDGIEITNVTYILGHSKMTDNLSDDVQLSINTLSMDKLIELIKSEEYRLDKYIADIDTGNRSDLNKVHLTINDDGKQKSQSVTIGISMDDVDNYSCALWGLELSHLYAYAETENEALEEFKRNYIEFMNKINSIGVMLLNDELDMFEVDCTGHKIGIYKKANTKDPGNA